MVPPQPYSVVAGMTAGDDDPPPARRLLCGRRILGRNLCQRNPSNQSTHLQRFSTIHGQLRLRTSVNWPPTGEVIALAATVKSEWLEPKLQPFQSSTHSSYLVLAAVSTTMPDSGLPTTVTASPAPTTVSPPAVSAPVPPPH